MAHTHKLSVVATRIQSLVEANQVALTIDDVWYGDQAMVPAGRTVCIEPITVDRRISGAPDMVENNFQVALLVYITKVQDVQLTRAECDSLAEALEDLLHLHLNLDDNAHTPGSDIVIHGFVAENMSGYTYKEGRLIRSAKLTWLGKSKTSLRFGP